MIKGSISLFSIGKRVCCEVGLLNLRSIILKIKDRPKGLTAGGGLRIMQGDTEYE